MSKKPMLMQKSLTVEKVKTCYMPSPLDEASETELLRKTVVGKTTTVVLNFLSAEFVNRGFEWLLPVVLSQSTDPLWPDQNASIEKRVEIEIYGKTVRPTASMIVHKLVACSLVHPKLFILSPNVRIEKSERSTTGVHAYEFTQLDFEIRDATSRNVRSIVDSILCGLMAHLKSNVDNRDFCLRKIHDLPSLKGPFKVYDREILEKEFGEDWEQKLVEESDEPFWVTNIPREFYDFEDFETGRWDNYDLFLPGYGEILSGARREHEYNKIIAKMDRCGVRKENYQSLLKLAKDGRLKPTAGAGIGLERLVSWLIGAKHVGEVQLFPRIPGLIYEL